MLKLIMSKKSLIETNPYLKDPELRKELTYQSVASSTAIEGVLTRYKKLSRSAEKKLRMLVRESGESCG